MNLLELTNYLQEGREIEFSIDSKHYFLSSDWGVESPKDEYYIFDDDKKIIIAEGTLQEILSFEFQPNISFQTNINIFSFDFVL